MEIYRNPSKKQNRSVKYIAGCGPNGIGIVSFFGCNLKCHFCFAQKYSYMADSFKIDKSGRIDINSIMLYEDIKEFLYEHPSICYIQLTGGEPFLNKSRIEGAVESLTRLDKGLSSEVRVIYQTNGISLGKEKDLIQCFRQLNYLRNKFILFELSIKGTNEREFGLLTGQRDREAFLMQLEAYWMLTQLRSSNTEVVARLGAGHHKKTIHFIDPETGESLFLRKNWDHRFTEVFDDTYERFGVRRMITERINAEGDGSVNNYLHRSIPAIARCLRKGLIVSRSYTNKAIDRAINEYGGFIKDISRERLHEDYEDFLANFEPMDDPAHAYCGRNEFKREQRRSCNPSCRYHELT